MQEHRAFDDEDQGQEGEQQGGARQRALQGIAGRGSQPLADPRQRQEGAARPEQQPVLARGEEPAEEAPVPVLVRLGPVRTAIVSTVEPFLTALLAVVVLSQPLTLPTMVGGALVVAAVVAWRAMPRPRKFSSVIPARTPRKSATAKPVAATNSIAGEIA